MWNKNHPILSEEDFALFQKLLLKESGLHFEKDKINILSGYIWERMQEKGISSFSEYYEYLKYSIYAKGELNELFDLITIGETYFFRNYPHFNALLEHILPEILVRKKDLFYKSLRVWSAGCSKGAEPYTIAMIIKEVVPDLQSWNVSILGTDLNRNFLLQAEKGIYSKRDVKGVPEEFFSKYFRKEGSVYLLSEEIKKMVKFLRHNMVVDAFVNEGMQNLDIIFCRNVTIYFDTETTKNLISKFYDCLNDEGYLFLGHAETLWGISDKFVTVEFPDTFIYKKTKKAVKMRETARPHISIPEIKFEALTVPQPSQSQIFSKEKVKEVETSKREIEFPSLEEVFPSVPSVKPQETSLPESEEVVREVDDIYKEALSFFHKKDFQKSIELLDKVINKDKNYIKAYLVKADILAYEEKYKEAIEQLEKIITFDNLYVEAYYLLGVLFSKIEDYESAKKQFKKALYVNPDLALVYFNLANIYIYQNKKEEAIRQLKNAIKLLEKANPSEIVPLTSDCSAEFLLYVCHSNLKRLTI